MQNLQRIKVNAATKPILKEVAMKDFVINIEEIKRRARQHLECGAVTKGYAAGRETTINLLNEALATEIVCVMRYKLHHQMAKGLNSEPVAKEFAEHAREEQEHVDMIAKRISQLNGEPNFNPEGLVERAHSEYVRCDDLVEMIRENLVAERIVIDIYGEMIRFFGNDDPTTRRMLEHILRNEEEHAEDLSNLLPEFDADMRAANVFAARVPAMSTEIQ